MNSGGLGRDYRSSSGGSSGTLGGWLALLGILAVLALIYLSNRGPRPDPLAGLGTPRPVVSTPLPSTPLAQSTPLPRPEPPIARAEPVVATPVPAQPFEMPAPVVVQPTNPDQPPLKPFFQDPAMAPAPATPPVPSRRRGVVVGVRAGDSLNIRAEPASGAPIVTTAGNGEVVEIDGPPVQSGGSEWFPIRVGGQQGWVNRAYVQSMNE